MNFLAHIFLSCQEEDLLIGNFIADSIRNKEMADYVPTIQRGIALHRKIDSYTDTHPMVRRSTHRLHPHHGKYAPVVVDILFDYVLSHNWDKYSSEPLPLFSKKIYWLLEQRIADLPLKMQRRVPTMIREDWLMKYGQEDGLRYVFQTMEKRAKFPANFDKAVDNLLAEYDAFEEDFNLFFPDVIGMVNEFCGCD